MYGVRNVLPGSHFISEGGDYTKKAKKEVEQ